MRYQLPEGCTSISVGGKEHKGDADGCVEIDPKELTPELAAEIAAHGLTTAAKKTHAGK